MRHANCRILLAAFLVVLVQIAWADGGMFPWLSAGSAASVDQRAIVVFDDGRETLILQTAYEGDGSDFAWVIPIPTLLGSGDISTCDAAVFDELYYLTEPSAYGGGHSAQALCGCGGGGSEGQEFRSVRVWDTFQVDDYELAILSATESEDLEAWLNDNGYAFPPGHQAELDHYVGAEWFFVAVKISPSVTQDRSDDDLPPDVGGGYGEEGQEMRPLRLCFATPEPVYPMRISAVSTRDEVEVLLYVIARYRVTATNYNTQEVALTSEFSGDDFPAYYEQQFRSTLAQAGAGSLLVEYAGPLGAYLTDRYGAELGLGPGTFYVTRLRTYLRPEHMQQDVLLAQAASDDRFDIRIAAAPDALRPRLAGVGLLFLAAATLGLVSGDRRALLRLLLLAAIIGVLIL